MIIWLVGRTNVGKSTLFNRLVGTYRAIVTDIAGTTRELLREEVDFARKHATFVDSPGLEDFALEQKFIQEIIDEADLLLFVVDGKGEIGEQDYLIRDMIIAAGKIKKTLLIVNKLDGQVYGKKATLLLADRYALWFEHILPTSAKQEEGMVDVFEWLVSLASRVGIEQKREKTTSDIDPNDVKLALVGRPNVGKSTLLNTLTGEELARVQDTPGTTLDYIKAEFTYKNMPIHLYDTAGIRKKGKIVWLERIAYAKTLKMISWVKPLVVVIVDIEEGLTHRDKSLLGELITQGVPLVVAVNKIDLYEPDIADRKLAQIKHHMVGGDWIPVVKISGKDGLGLPQLLDTVIKVHKQYHTRVSTWWLNDALSKAWMTSPPRFPKNKICKRKYISQVETSPPVFFLSVNNKEYVNFSFKKWVENVIRKHYTFTWTPIRLTFGSKAQENPYVTDHKDRKNKHEDKEI